MNKYQMLFLTTVASLLLHNLALAQEYMPHEGKTAMAPDGWLLNTGNPWFYHGEPSSTPVDISTRPPNANEQKVIERAKFLFANRAAKALVLLDGKTVVYSEYKSPANLNSYLMSYSMGKTITSMAVGEAICTGALSMSTRADELIPELAGKALGKATVLDLLKMASGTREGSGDEAFTPAQNKLWDKGELNLLDVIVDDRVSGAQKGMFHEYLPGERFWYQGTSPLTLGLMINAATHKTFAEWATSTVFQPAGIAHQVIIGQDKLGHAASNGNIRLKMDDWIRVAAWAKDATKQAGCFGDFMREASKTQIKNSAKKNGVLFDGYGYLTWTENRYAPHTYWAVGYGGQRIGWSDSNDRMIVFFSSAEDWMGEAYELFDSWQKLN